MLTQCMRLILFHYSIIESLSVPYPLRRRSVAAICGCEGRAPHITTYQSRERALGTEYPGKGPKPLFYNKEPYSTPLLPLL